MPDFHIVSPYKMAGDQPQAVAKLVEGINNGLEEQTLMGVTGSGKTFTMANIIAAGAQHLLHQHGVHVHRAKVVFQNTHLMSLLYQIPHIAAQKGGLACAQKAGDEIHLNHIFLPPLQKPSQRRSAREGLYFSLFSGAAIPG